MSQKTKPPYQWTPGECGLTCFDMAMVLLIFWIGFVAFILALLTGVL